MESALYRKYRPQSFKEVLGQEHITKVLSQAFALGNIAHAYLFSGSRGTGKTSIARIIARELGSSENDIYEIDAASNRGIDDIRELRESVRGLPFDSRFKVYIIDEVHMLTKEAFNALLKTLEEPPSHVIFILATTELEKVPETIISRCQSFVFKKPTNTVLKEFAESIAKKEDFKIDSASAELIAILGDGSFRDTHGILQKIFSFSKDKKISLEEIESVTGAPSGTLVNSFIEAIVLKDIEKGLELIKKASEKNLDLKTYLKLIIFKIRLCMIIRFSPEMTRNLNEEISESDLLFLKDLVKKDKGLLGSKTLEILLVAYSNIDNSFVKEIALELALVKILKGEE